MDYANIILEMLDRIKKLETDVEKLKRSKNIEEEAPIGSPYTIQTPTSKPSECISTTNKRDTTRYMFEGNVYLKNRLVLAVVQKYVQDNPDVTRTNLKQVFSKTLQGSLGVVEDVEIASQRRDYEVRFFTKEKEIIRLIDGEMYVCSQWGILNIPNFLKAAENIGYIIESI